MDTAIAHLKNLFGPPYNWCDGRCFRCPLGRDCPVCQRMERKWWQVTHGEVPENFPASIKSIKSMMNWMAMLTHIVEQGGLWLDDSDTYDSRVSLSAARLQDAAMVYLDVFHNFLMRLELSRLDEKSYTMANYLIGNAVLLFTKIERITGGLTPDGVPRDADVWASDSVPNLLLITWVDREVATRLQVFSPRVRARVVNAYAKASGMLHCMLAELIERIPSATHEGMRQLIEARLAPSPFCISDSGELAPYGGPRWMVRQDSRCQPN